MNCNEANPLLDAYVDSQLSGEEYRTVASHVEVCQRCGTRVTQIRRMKHRIAGAVSGEPTPLGLETRLRARLAESSGSVSGLRFSFAWAGALGVLALTVAGWVMVWQPLQRQVLAVLGVGADDHVHCSLERKKPPFGTLQRPIDPEYGDLLARVTKSMPPGYELRESHYCRTTGKRFQHVVFEHAGSRVSVIVTPKTVAGDFPAIGVLAARMRADGIPLYSADVLGVSAAGFESGQNIAFVVSDRGQAENLRLLAGLAPALKGAMERHDR